MKIVTILVRHGEAKYTDAELQLNSIFDRQLPNINRRTIIVDNALSAEFREDRGETTVIGGDNRAWEFSAWNRAIKWLNDDIWSYDLVHLVTSAFHTLYTKYLDRFSEPMLESIATRPVCLGHIDCYNEAVRIGAFTSQHWSRTSFLFIPPVEIKILKDLVSLNDPEEWFSGEPDQVFTKKAEISQNYQRYVLDWLTGSDIGQGSTWHSTVAVNSESWSMFKGKATAIFNEHLLAIRLRAQGTRLIDTTWLASILNSHSASTVDWSASWRKQLAERDTDAIVVPELL
jgi:hypothetical protein